MVVRGQTLEESLEAANARFETTMSGKTDDARALFESAGGAWSEHFDARHAQLRALIDDSAGVIGGQIDESARRAADAVAAEAIAAQERLEAAARAALERWSDQTRQVGEKFTTAANEAVASIAVGGDSVNDTLGATIASLEDTLSARGGALVADLNNQTRRIEEQLGALNALVGESGESAIERIAAHTGQLSETLSTHIESIDSVMNSRKTEIDERLNEHQAHLDQRLDEHRARFDENLSEHRNRFDESLSQHRDRFDESLGDHRNHFDQSLGEHRRRLEEASAARLALLVEFGVTPGDAIKATPSARTRTIEIRKQEEYVKNCKPLASARMPRSREEKALAVLLGGAVGDAFGYEVEFDSISKIRTRFGASGITEPIRHNGKLIVSDDTQMTLFTLEGMLRYFPRTAFPLSRA